MGERWVFTFRQRGDFAALNAARSFLTKAGFSFGTLQRGAPIGVLFGDFAISKWRNLRKADIAALHGRIVSDTLSYRDQPIHLVIYADAPAEAHEALHRHHVTAETADA